MKYETQIPEESAIIILLLSLLLSEAFSGTPVLRFMFGGLFILWVK